MASSRPPIEVGGASSISRIIFAMFLLGLVLVPDSAGTSQRPRWRTWAVAILGLATALAVAGLSLQAHARYPATEASSTTGAAIAAAAFVLPDTGVPDDESSPDTPELSEA